MCAHTCLELNSGTLKQKSALAGTATDWLQILITFALKPVSTPTNGYHLLCCARGSQQLAKFKSLQIIFIRRS